MQGSYVRRLFALYLCSCYDSTMIQTRRELTDADREQHANEVQAFNLQAAHTEKIKQMELDGKLAEIRGRLDSAKATRESQERIRNAELELARIEARWLSWLRIPITVVKLPVYVVFGLAYCIAVARKHEPSEAFWRFLNL